MSAYIRLFGEKHHLASATLRTIRDSVGSVDPELAEGITAYLRQVVEDDCASNPLLALEQIGRDIIAVIPQLPELASKWARSMQDTAKVVIYYGTTGWPDTAEADSSAFFTLEQHCEDLKHWANMLAIYGYPVVSDEVKAMAVRFGRIINLMELCG